MNVAIQSHHLLTKIDLSGFNRSKVPISKEDEFKYVMFAKAGLQELVSGIDRLPVIRAVSLRNNGINDEHEKEILALLSISKIKSVDLSCNEIEGKLAAKIGRKLHEVSHI